MCGRRPTKFPPSKTLLIIPGDAAIEREIAPALIEAALQADANKRPGACARPVNLELVAGACNEPNAPVLFLPFSYALVDEAAA